MRGSYALIAELNKGSKIKVGKLGLINFNKGYYIYVGSALNGLEARINRHLRKNKKIYWHIDYLLKKAKVKEVFYKKGLKKEECVLAKEMGKHFMSVKDFGCSDCKCRSHLFYDKDCRRLKNKIIKIGTKLKYEPKN